MNKRGRDVATEPWLVKCVLRIGAIVIEHANRTLTRDELVNLIFEGLAVAGHDDIVRRKHVRTILAHAYDAREAK